VRAQAGLLDGPSTSESALTVRQRIPLLSILRCSKSAKPRTGMGQSRRDAFVRSGGEADMATQRNDVVCQQATLG
jgi:hypothetical protein